MIYHDTDNPYDQLSLPFQAYKDPADTSLSQQQKLVLVSTPSKARTSPRTSQPGSSQPRLSKAEALAFVATCKRWLIAGSIVAFGVLSGLVAGHIAQATTSNQATPASNATTTSPSDDGSFFQQQQGGYNFGNGNIGQPPVSSSRTS